MQHIALHLIRTARYWREHRLLCWLALAYPPRRLRRTAAIEPGDIDASQRRGHHRHTH
ncbi:hypothetical protein [Saccharopolyspora sp. NPDC049426]|uniref:hypothetical protein n=1 Tax=Saccharopolyspora sp. NPDC049426 TaxID=3155652 RepID=UPI00343FD098